MTPRAYLAGPDVFLRDAEALSFAKRGLCERYGFTGISPIGNIIDFSGLSKREAALRIAQTGKVLHRS
jgi:nucleoside 2-deoxyribosyltransferase